VRLRWTINRNTGENTLQKIRGFAAVLVHDVAITVADAMWIKLRTQIAVQIRLDVKREISKMAQRYKIMTIGVSAGYSGAVGTLSPASEIATGFPNPTYRLTGTRPWAPRNTEYLRRKQKRMGHQDWFSYRGGLGAMMGRADTWIEAFGPIVVQITRSALSSSDAFASGYKPENRLPGVGAAAGNKQRVAIANVRVAAFQNITPAMLPALISGNIDEQASDGRRTGLIGLFPSPIAYALGGGHFVPYRHTIEPFLGYVLTRAIPNAVMRRLQVGLGTDLKASIA